MKLYREGIENFAPWSGAASTWDAIENLDKVDELESILDELHPDGMSETELNDLLWFEPETVCEWLGLYYNGDTGDISDTEPDDENEEE